MPLKTALLFVGDSRAHGFDRYDCPQKVTVHFVIKRGARVDDLVAPTLTKLQSLYSYDIVIVKIACGINNFTQFVKRNNVKDLVESAATERSVFNELVEFKKAIKHCCPKALVGFVTIPTLSFVKYRDTRVGKEHSQYSDRELSIFQSEVDGKLKSLNIRIKLENSTRQSGFETGCRTVSWHNSITRQSRRKRRDGTSRTVTRTCFNQLYDGLHAVRPLKRKWFDEVCKAALAERRYLKRYI
ncbi:MAG: hypothetical protein ABW185_29925 [Sedimenticola sp.]